MILSGIITLILGFILNYLFLPAWNFQSGDFWLFLIVLMFIFYILNIIIDSSETVIYGLTILGAIILGIFIILFIISAPLFSSSKYKNRITVKESDFNTDIPLLKDVKSIALMDSDSAKILGDRTIGELSDLVSQYNVSNDYFTIQIAGNPWKISPLEYNSPIKYINNSKVGIPGYVLVNPITNESKFVRLEKGFNYSPSAFFGKDLNRHLRNQFPTKMFTKSTFQVDDDGNAFWITAVKNKKTPLGASYIVGAVITDSVSGNSVYYNLQEIPSWVDIVYDGDFICELYNYYGRYTNGFFNGWFGQKGCTKTTNDFGYIMKDDDVFIYTGVTSLASDKSNLGFIMVNSRTGEYSYYTCSGADETSAMNAAQGVMQNYGYIASFPSLVNISEEPTYVMVLKDNNGLVKMYAMVNAKQYSIVAVEENLNKTYNSYVKALSESGKKVDIPIIDNLIEKNIEIKDLKFISVEGNTIVYITDTDNNVYKQSFNESHILLNPSDKCTIYYDKDSQTDKIILINNFKVN